MESKIVLSVTATGFNATFHGPCGDEVEKAFGTRTIPTAFTAAARVEDVRKALRALNPGVLVK
jgi:hypothetical protein